MSRLAEALRTARDPVGATTDATAVHVPVESVESSHSHTKAPTTTATAIAAPPRTLRESTALGEFSRFDPHAAGKIIVSPTIPPAAVEQYRKLAATLHHLQVAKDISVAMVTSAVPGEGKTLTTTNLALTFSHSYRRRVLLIDADLRRPSLHQIFGVPNVAGLNDGLKDQQEQKLPLIQISEYLTVLPAGRPDPDPMSGLTSDRMRRIIKEASSRFDWVLIDTPPVGLLPDANLLAAMVDVAVLVVRAGKSPFKLVKQAIDAVGRQRIVGVVLNAVEQTTSVASYGYYGYYGPRDRTRRDHASDGDVGGH